MRDKLECSFSCTPTGPSPATHAIMGEPSLTFLQGTRCSPAPHPPTKPACRFVSICNSYSAKRARRVTGRDTPGPLTRRSRPVTCSDPNEVYVLQIEIVYKRLRARAEELPKYEESSPAKPTSCKFLVAGQDLNLRHPGKPNVLPFSKVGMAFYQFKLHILAASVSRGITQKHAISRYN